ncbi:MAG: hypothetical protein ACM3JD_14320 [Rudaea sp.]
MPQYGTWLPYTGSAVIVLAVLLLLAAAVLAFLGTRLRHPLRPQHPGRAAAVLLVLIWILDLMTFGNCGLTYFQALTKEYGNFTPPPSPISNVTAVAGFLAFVVIMILTRDWGWKMALVSAIVGAIAGPMIFELPFDLIVMGRIYPRPTPLLQLTLLFFLPLILWQLASFLLLTLSTAASLTRNTLFVLAAMFFVFAGWALFGFSYPDTLPTVALNVIGKLLAFAAAVSLFAEAAAEHAPAGQTLPAGALAR